MDAEYIGNWLLSLKDNPNVGLLRSPPMSIIMNRSGSQYHLLNFTRNTYPYGKSPKGYVFLSTDNLNLTRHIKDKEMVDPFENATLINFKKVVETVLEMKEILPALIGIDDGFDKLIAEKLKQ